MHAAKTPPPLDFRDPGSFASHTLARRVPVIIAEALRGAHPAPAARARLRRAQDDPGGLRVRRLALPGDERPLWEPFFAAHAGRRLRDLPFFEMEAYLYAWLSAETGHFTSGRDPFTSAKRRDLEASWARMEAASQAVAHDDVGPTRVAVRSALLRSLLGNDADASNPQLRTEGSAGVRLEQRAPWTALDGLLLGPRRIALLADNALSELWYDLLLLRALLRAAPGRRVELVLKRHPLFVSDAMPSDLALLWRCIARRRVAPTLRRLAEELRTLVETERIAVQAWPELNAPLHFSAPALARRLAGDTAFLVKGDANYRRALEDRAWDPATPLDRACRMRVREVVFLRVLKSECVAGLPAATVRRLGRADPAWRVNGRHATVQVVSRR